MKKTILLFAVCILATMQLWAQPSDFKVQGIPRPDLNKKMQALDTRPKSTRGSLSNDPYDYSKFSFDDIQFWVGTGTNRAALIIDWYDAKGNETAMVWGYRWHNDSIRTGYDMVKAIARTDKRFLLLSHFTGGLGSTVAGLGYDQNNNGNPSLLFKDDTNNPFFPVAGVVMTTEYNYDEWTSTDPNDHWRAGWYGGYWSYQVKEAGEIDFSYSGQGASARELQNGSCDGWAFTDFSDNEMSGTLPRMPFTSANVALRITAIQLIEKKVTLAPSEQILMSYSATSEEDIKPNLHWTSTNTRVATVDQNGQVTATSVGVAQIIVTETDTQLADTCSLTVEEAKYTDGVFFLNEDWYGHNNGTINYLDSKGEWHYRVYQKENPGKELGSSTSYGTVYADKLFIISKQDKDPGATIKGSRLAVCNATTMKSLAEFPTIGGADGRSFVGVTQQKGYIGTSNGIYLFDIDNLTLKSKLEGTDNASGSLYNGQIGTMVQAAGRVFAVNQQKGVMIIDAQNDTLQRIITAPIDGTKQRGFGSIVQSKDGYLWLSIATNTSGGGGGEEYLLKLNPQTLDTIRVKLPKGASIPNSWYAWTADGFCSSTQQNKLYWKNNGGWFNSTKIFEYDIDSNSVKTVFESTLFEPSQNWGIYGAGFRLDPRTDEIYVSLFKSFGEQSYKVVKVNHTNATVMADYPMADGYWFPAVPVFPDIHAPVVSNLIADISTNQHTQIYLGDKANDADNMQTAIVKSILSVSNKNLLNAEIKNDSLMITPVDGQSGTTSIVLQFNSNGKMATKNITVEIPWVKANGVVLDKNQLSINVNKSYQLTASTLPVSATNKNVTWESSNPTVATVDNGLITAHAQGSTTITVTTVDGEHTATCIVTVVDSSTGINSTEGIQYHIYPTVTTGLITIKLEKPATQAIITNISGRVIQTIPLNSLHNSINISSYEQGIYLIIIGNKTVRVVKK